MGINREVIEKVCDCIRLEKTPFVMREWFSKFYDGYWWTDFDPINMLFGNMIIPEVRCGTAACGGGWAVVLFPEEALKILKDRNAFDMDQLACRLYGISEEEGSVLFYARYWPSKYRELGDKNGFLAICERALNEGNFGFLLKEDQNG